MKKALLVIIGLALLVGAGFIGYSANNKNGNDSNATSSTQTKSNGDTKEVDFKKIYEGTKAQVPTLTELKIYTESNDPNNLIGKKGQYISAAAFKDSRVDMEGDDWGADGGGGIEVFANESDAKARAEYFSNFGSGSLGPGAYEQVGVYVVRASPDLTKSQQDEMIAAIKSQLD